jgi:hypothetical protein
MTFWFQTAAVLLAGSLAFLVIRHAPYFWKAMALVVFSATVAVAYLSYEELLGRPKPVQFEWLISLDKAHVAASLAIEGQAIYLWLLTQDAPAPRAYMIPWSEKAAKELQKANERTKRNHGQTGMRKVDGEWRFYSQPPPPLPPKAIP